MRERSTKATYLFLSLFVFILFLTTFAHAAIGPGTPIEPDYDPDAAVPIDGGASLLVAAGVAYGLKKIHDKRKENKNLEI